MKSLLSILPISLLAACSNPSETIQQAPSAPAPAPNTASTRDIPRNEAFVLDPHTVTPQALAAAEACRIQARPLWNSRMAVEKLEAAIINKNLQRWQEREQGSR